MSIGYQTSNPALSKEAFARARAEARVADAYNAGAASYSIPTTMTLQGTVVRTSILVVVLLITATIAWTQTFTEVAARQAGAGVTVTPLAGTFLVGGIIGGLIFSLITIFVPRFAPVTAPLYAAAEGLALGTISAIFEVTYQGIVLNAVGLTIGTLVVLLAMYGTGMIRATPMFQRVVIAATGAIALMYVVNMIMRMFGTSMPFLHTATPLGIGISLVIVVVAALNLVLDFNLIEQNVDQGAPRFMEWYCGFSLLLTLVWLYLELLRLLAMLRQRD